MGFAAPVPSPCINDAGNIQAYIHTYGGWTYRFLNGLDRPKEKQVYYNE
jgi:hypothetical protein